MTRCFWFLNKMNHPESNWRSAAEKRLFKPAQIRNNQHSPVAAGFKLTALTVSARVAPQTGTAVTVRAVQDAGPVVLARRRAASCRHGRIRHQGPNRRQMPDLSSIKRMNSQNELWLATLGYIKSSTFKAEMSAFHIWMWHFVH